MELIDRTQGATEEVPHVSANLLGARRTEVKVGVLPSQVNEQYLASVIGELLGTPVEVRGFRRVRNASQMDLSQQTLAAPAGQPVSYYEVTYFEK